MDLDPLEIFRSGMVLIYAPYTGFASYPGGGHRDLRCHSVDVFHAVMR